MSDAQLCPTVCNCLYHSLPGSSVCGIFPARTLEWVAMPSSSRCLMTLLFGLLWLFSFVSAFSHFSGQNYSLAKLFSQTKGTWRTWWWARTIGSCLVWKCRFSVCSKRQQNFQTLLPIVALSSKDHFQPKAIKKQLQGNLFVLPLFA